MLTFILIGYYSDKTEPMMEDVKSLDSAAERKWTLLSLVVH